MNVEDYIVKIDGAMPADLCNALIDEYGPSNLWSAARVESGYFPEKTDVYSDLDMRESDLITMSLPDVLSDKQERIDLDTRVMECVSSVNQSYRDKFPYATCFRDSGYELLRYGVGGKFRQHVDNTQATIRTISISFTLNDEFEGGEFAFFDDTLRYKLGKGDCLMFPSNFIYPHEVLPITSGTRYAIVTWMR
jgi:hypothetical protein